ncbi:hypothetical protein WSM22_05940 [Cytophagales bacterium WSM2-2]|nr:hypothetical protein WSM22_05940 [Cytophagales bacterium WSM2-2]
MTLRNFFLQLLLLTLAHVNLAQTLTIEGKVINSKSKSPVAYANIGVAGSAIGTISNMEGAFTLKVPAFLAGKYSIRISCMGFETTSIKNPESNLTIELKESPTMLREVVVLSNDLSARGIVNLFLKNIKKNYYPKSFLYKTFYRHYCKDDTTYGRLIEAAVDLYKRKGMKAPQPRPGSRDEVKVTQLRRSFDNTNIASTHMPIALYNVMGIDPVSYQSQSSNRFDFIINPWNVSHLKKDRKKFKFDIEGMTRYDDEDVYIISFKYRDTTFSKSGLFSSTEAGKLYITTKNYALLRMEAVKYRSFDTINYSVSYKRINGKYFLAHSVKDGNTFYPRDKFHHNYHIELTTTDVQLKNFKSFKGKEPVKEELLEIEYDSLFWKDYNILKATPLEENIVTHLEKKQPLKNQYGDFLKKERERVLGGKEQEEKFNEMLTGLRGKGRPILLDFWATWCAPCISEIDYSKQLFENYKSKVYFFFLSVDADWRKWKEVLEKYDLKGLHYRIGPTSDAAILFDVTSIPRYILLDQNGSIVHLEAKRPSDPELSKQIDKLLDATKK